MTALALFRLQSPVARLSKIAKNDAGTKCRDLGRFRIEINLDHSGSACSFPCHSSNLTAGPHYIIVVRTIGRNLLDEAATADTLHTEACDIDMIEFYRRANRFLIAMDLAF